MHFNIRKAAVIAVACAFAYALAPSSFRAEAKPAKSAAPGWYASWTASPFDVRTLPPKIFAPSVDTLSNQTVRQIITISRGGSQVRVRFSNEFGKTALHIGAAALGYSPSKGGPVQRTALTFGGASSASVSAEAPLVSDPVSVRLPDRAEIEISIYLPDQTAISTIHLLGLQPSTISGPGNYVMADTLPGAVPFEIVEQMHGTKFPARLIISEVDLAGAAPARTVVAFGDSITDGMGSTPDVSRRWPDDLERRIVQAKLNLAVINQGIGGNQILANGLGVSALARFDRDVLAVPGASTVIILEGINDIGFSGGMVPGFSRPDIIPAEEIIQGYRQLIARTHAHGLRIIAATMTPFAGSPAFTPEKEAVRLAVNNWIRTSRAFDAMVDFDLVAKDPQHPEKLKTEYDAGDHIHLNDAGYEAMAAAVPLSALTRSHAKTAKRARHHR